MISYEPLLKTLDDKQMKVIDLVKKCGLGSATVAKIRKDEGLSVTSLEKICLFLNVPIEKVIKISQQ